MALAYRQRLVGLRSSGYLKNVDAAWWNQTLADSLLAEAEETGETLRPL
jgi:hypothetical protein